MRVRLLLALVLTAPVGACGEDVPSSGRVGQAESTTVDSQLNGDVAFALELLAAQETAKLREDIPTARVEEERAYTQKWLKVALRPSVYAKADSGRMRLISRIGARGDDAVVATWALAGQTVDVIDGRVLVFSVHVTHESGGVEELWRALFADDRVLPTANVVVQPFGTASGAERGTIRPTKAPTGWFESPIRWCRLTDRTVFAFEKRLEAPMGKGPKGRWIPEGNAAKYIGGIPTSDRRAYLRFEPTNRVSLAAEWAREINGPISGDKPFEGPAYGAPTGRSENPYAK